MIFSKYAVNFSPYVEP